MKEVKTDSLENGFRLYSLCDSGAHLAGVGVKAGSIFDPPDAHGFFHGGEHIVCHETENYSAREIEVTLREYDCGPRGSIKIETDYTSTFYGTDMLMYREHMKKLFRIFADMVTQPAMKDSGWLAERAAVFTEYLERGKDSLKDEANWHLRQLIYEKNPVRNRVDCNPEDFKKLSLERLHAGIRRYYVPNNMFAVILGPPIAEAKAMIEEHFGHLEPREVPKLDYDFSDSQPMLGSIKSRDEFLPGFSTYHATMGFVL